jgi:hypothetical protein
LLVILILELLVTNSLCQLRHLHNNLLAILMSSLLDILYYYLVLKYEDLHETHEYKNWKLRTDE